MIGRLTGNVVNSRPDEVLLDVGGVGYRLHVPLSTYFVVSGASAAPVSLHVHTHVREDAIQLFGFATEREREAFESLLSVSGIGPRTALAVLSGTDVDELERAVTSGERALLEKIPGIGRRTAERVLVELRDRWPKGESGPRRKGKATDPRNGSPSSAVDADAVSALLHLGYPEEKANGAVSRVRRDVGAEGTLQDVLRAALRALAR